jgi:hypothetical protein
MTAPVRMRVNHLFLRLNIVTSSDFSLPAKDLTDLFDSEVQFVSHHLLILV